MADESTGYSGGNALEPKAFPELASVLRSETEGVMHQWDEVAQQLAGKLSLEQTRDEMPQILDTLANLLEDPSRQHMQNLVDRRIPHTAVMIWLAADHNLRRVQPLSPTTAACSHCRKSWPSPTHATGAQIARPTQAC